MGIKVSKIFKKLRIEKRLEQLKESLKPKFGRSVTPTKVSVQNFDGSGTDAAPNAILDTSIKSRKVSKGTLQPQALTRPPTDLDAEDAVLADDAWLVNTEIAGMPAFQEKVKAQEVEQLSELPENPVLLVRG